MIYICVRTYGNGKHMNKVHNIWFEWLSQAEYICDKLNKLDSNDTFDRWGLDEGKKEIMREIVKGGAE